MIKTNQLSTACILGMASLVLAETTIDPMNKNAYGANVGWINAQGDITNGMVVGQAFCSGYIYSANCGWIDLGDGSPANQVAYANDSATDFGVNHDGSGNLTGYAYGANIGWLTFEQTYGKPNIDLLTGALSGYVWSANAGWISLHTSEGYVKTATLHAGPDSDSDGIPDAWELGYTNLLTGLSGSGDADGDGVSDADEYRADTNPTDADDLLIITDLTIKGSTNTLTWTAKPTRTYQLQRGATLTNWIDGVPGIPVSGPEMSESVIGITNGTQFYRVKATLPLSE